MLIPGLSLDCLKIVQVLGITTVEHPGRGEEMGRWSQWRSKYYCWRIWSICAIGYTEAKEGPSHPTFLHLGTSRLIVNYVSLGGKKRQFNSPWKLGLGLTLCLFSKYLVLGSCSLIPSCNPLALTSLKMNLQSVYPLCSWGQMEHQMGSGCRQ